jgi:hypothetical protein
MLDKDPLSAHELYDEFLGRDYTIRRRTIMELTEEGFYVDYVTLVVNGNVLIYLL